jgi:hypothetical protein
VVWSGAAAVVWAGARAAGWAAPVAGWVARAVGWAAEGGAPSSLFPGGNVRPIAASPTVGFFGVWPRVAIADKATPPNNQGGRHRG